MWDGSRAQVREINQGQKEGYLPRAWRKKENMCGCLSVRINPVMLW